MSQMPDEHSDAETSRILSRLDDLDDVALADQVEVFQTVHDELAARLSRTEG